MDLFICLIFCHEKAVSLYWYNAFLNIGGHELPAKSTDGFSIGNILLDFSGGVANYAQMAVQSIDQGSLSLPQPMIFAVS